MQQSPHRGESFFRPATLIAAATSSGNSGPGGQPDRSATAVLRNSSEDPPATAPAAGPTDWPAGTDKGDLRPDPAYEARASESAAARTGCARQDARIRFRPCGPAKAAPIPEHKSPPLKKRIAPDERSPSRAIFYPQPAACRRHSATTTLPPPPFPAAGKRLPSKQSDRRFSTGTEKRHRPEHTFRTNRGRFSASALPILRSSRILPSAPCPGGTADPPRHAVRPVARPRSVSDTHRTGRNRKRQEAQRAQKRYPR